MLIIAALFFSPSDCSLQETANSITKEELASGRVHAEIDYLYQVARGEREDMEKTVMVGLAAPQVGIHKQMILVDVGVGSEKTALGELRFYANPEIIWNSDEIVLGREGCCSVDSHILAIVPRAKTIKIRAWNRNGEFIEEELTG